MKLSREQWTPLTVVIETHEEAEILHKILACVLDVTAERMAPTSLFLALGRGLDPKGSYRVTGEVTLNDAF